MFTPEQRAELDKPLAKDRIAHRRQGRQGPQLSYLEGFDVIDTANAIFGYEGWSYSVDRLELAGDLWLAVVTAVVDARDGQRVARQDVGVGIPAIARDATEPTPDAIETAIKGAVTDALKRALRTFGNQMGNSLYDKDGDAAPPSAPAEQPAGLRWAGQTAPPASIPAPQCKCGQPAVHRGGVNKEGKAWGGWFCAKPRDQQCTFKRWDSEIPTAEELAPPPEAPTPGNGHAGVGRERAGKLRVAAIDALKAQGYTDGEALQWVTGRLERLQRPDLAALEEAEAKALLNSAKVAAPAAEPAVR